MTKAVLSSRIFIRATEIQQEELRRELTYTIQQFGTGGKKPLVIKQCIQVTPDIVSIPSGRVDLIPEGHELVDKRVKAPVTFPEFRGTLRASQQDIYDEVDSSCIINAAPSWGKTYSGIAIAVKLAHKTLIVVHTLALRTQWEKEIKKTLGITAGVIGSGKFNIEPDIVVANIQTLSKCHLKVSEVFGTIIVDECFDYNTLVRLSDGSFRKIGCIVNSKETPLVTSYNPSTGLWEDKRVIKHYKQPQDTFLRIKFGQSSIKCTGNHKLYKRGMLECRAEDIVVGDYIMGFPTHKSKHSIKDWKLFIALVLGDGNISRTSKGIRLRVTHGESQLDWLETKANMLDQEVMFTKGVSGYCENSIYSFSSKTVSDELGLYDMIYNDKGNKAYIPEEILPFLDWRTLAFIIMDDGSLNANSQTVISMCEVSVEDIDRFGNHYFSPSEYTIYSCSKGYNYLRLKISATEKVRTECSKYFPNSMLYKIRGGERIGDYISCENGLYENYSLSRVDYIDTVPATGGYRYCIEVEDNHNFIASGKLVSNCHHSPASTFLKVVNNSKATYKIGLSGTLERKDGLHVLLTDLFSKKVFRPKRENMMVPTIYRIPTDVPFSDNASIPWAHRVNDLLGRKDFFNLVVTAAAAQAARGHKVLVVSDRVFFLENCHEILEDTSVCITGSIKSEERDTLIDQIYKDKDIIFATTSIFSEGISVNALSCLILTTPISNNSLLTQLIGRIVRVVDGKMTPEVLDWLLQGATAKRQAANRMGTYIKQGYEIKELSPVSNRFDL